MSFTRYSLFIILAVLVLTIVFCLYSVHFMENNDEYTTYVYVIPGGGPGTNGYPEWTKRRTIAAFEAFESLSGLQRERAIFLALSAGSLNAPNRRDSNGRIVFESQFTMKHLVELGVDIDKIHGDFMSWDTLTNALYLRQFVEGSSAGKSQAMKSRKVFINVFISDFHANRVKAAFTWVLNLQPKLPIPFELTIHSVSSEGIFSKSDIEERLNHEYIGTRNIEKNAKEIITMAQFYNFLMMGGHAGYKQYLRGNYGVTTTPGYVK